MLPPFFLCTITAIKIARFLSGERYGDAVWKTAIRHKEKRKGREKRWSNLQEASLIEKRLRVCVKRLIKVRKENVLYVQGFFFSFVLPNSWALKSIRHGTNIFVVLF